MSAVKPWVENLQLFNTRGGKRGGGGVRNNLQIPQLIMNERLPPHPHPPPLEDYTTLGVRCGKGPEESNRLLNE